MRIDVFLVEKGLSKSREYAKQLILNNQVIVNEKVVSKPSFNVSDNDDVKISGEILRYVGRGGLKLEYALKAFNVDLMGKTCLDIGASTGGFTDCMLQNGAAMVYAVDVGHGQLDEKLVADSRVVNMEGTNINSLTSDNFSGTLGFISTDVSFVSLTKILPKIKELLPYGETAVLLIKPQFEAGKSDISKNGIVKNRKTHIRVLKDIYAFCVQIGMDIISLDFSHITGGDGNIEYLAHISHTQEKKKSFDFDRITENAFTALKK